MASLSFQSVTLAFVAPVVEAGTVRVVAMYRNRHPPLPI
jgi:hypothetical protein